MVTTKMGTTQRGASTIPYYPETKLGLVHLQTQNSQLQLQRQLALLLQVGYLYIWNHWLNSKYELCNFTSQQLQLQLKLQLQLQSQSQMDPHIRK